MAENKDFLACFLEKASLHLGPHDIEVEEHAIRRILNMTDGHLRDVANREIVWFVMRSLGYEPAGRRFRVWRSCAKLQAELDREKAAKVFDD